MKPGVGAALVIVDLQNDFCPGGSLSVPEGDQVVPLIQRLIDDFVTVGQPVIFTRDAHPDDHISFIQQGGPWPPHCIPGTRGFDLHPDLQVPDGAVFFHKGYDRDRDAYSGFEGIQVGSKDRAQDLATWLRGHHVTTLFVVGLATDYCVKATVLDGLRLGFKVGLMTDGVRGVNLSPHDSEEALAVMKDRGAVLI